MTRTGTVTVNGGDLGTGNGSTLTNNGGGVVLTGSYASTGGVVLAGSGGLTVSSPDARLWTQATYSGATTVTSGQLNICGSGGISTNSAVSIASGATVNLTSFLAPTNINRTIAGLTGAGTLHSGGGGTVTVNKASGTDTFSGVISGGTGLIKAGAGTLVLAGTNTYSGATLVSGGALALHGNSRSAQIIVSAAAVLDLRAAPTATTTGSVSFDPGSTVSVLGTPSGQTVTLLTASGGISGTPSLLPAVPGYALVVNPNSLVLQASGSTFSGWLEGNDPTPQLLMNYALGGTGPLSSPALPVLTVDANGLTLTATVRNDDPSLRFYGQWTTDLSGTTDSWEDHTVELTPPDLSFSQGVEIDKPRKFMRLKVTKIP
jgi:autotransporter-associated beta strand protein